jgi:hypothetical protein
MLIHITDPNDSSVKGVLDTTEGFSLANLLAGGMENFFFANAASSAEPDVLFDLSSPPSFFDRPMLWGRLDQNGALELFLSPTTGDATHPFARLDDFRAVLQGTSAGTGSLFRSNVLPPQVDWGVSP